MNQVICIKCRKFVDYTVKEVDDVFLIKGEDIHYKKKLAFCKECGEEVWVGEFDDYNAKAPWEIYEKKRRETEGVK